VEWQSLKTQEYRYALLVAIARFWELFGVRRPMRFERPAPAGEYDEAIHGMGLGPASFIDQYLDAQPRPAPKLGGPPKDTAEPGPTSEE